MKLCRTLLLTHTITTLSIAACLIAGASPNRLFQFDSSWSASCYARTPESSQECCSSPSGGPGCAWPWVASNAWITLAAGYFPSAIQTVSHGFARQLTAVVQNTLRMFLFQCHRCRFVRLWGSSHSVLLMCLEQELVLVKEPFPSPDL